MHILKRLQILWTSFRFIIFRGARLPTFLSILSTALIFSLFNSTNPVIRSVFARLDNMIYDQRFNIAQGSLRTNQHNIVIVDIDQKSLAAEGHWPWSRFKLGDLVTQLTIDGALVIGFDVTFPEYERNLVRELQERLQLDADLAGNTDDLLPRLEEINTVIDGDRYFAESMKTKDIVLGYSFSTSEPARVGQLPEPIIQLDETTAKAIAFNEPQGYEANIDVLQNGANGGGFFDIVPDVDGLIRRYSMFMQFQNKLYPSLALDMARLYYFEDTFTPVIEEDSTRSFKKLVGIRMGQVLIPTNENAQSLIPFIGPSRSFPYISATDILHDTLSATERELLTNSLVLVGTTATGLYDSRATPVQSVYPGVEVHANVLNAILSSAPSLVIEGATTEQAEQNSFIMEALNQGLQSPFPSRPDWQAGAVMLAIMVVGLVLSLIYPHLGPALLALSSITFLLGLTVLNFHLWSSYNLDISLVILLLLVLLITAVNMTYGFVKEGINKKTIKSMFDQYVPPAHIDAMLVNPGNYNFDGESKDLSVMFADIRNFTTISEKLSAVELKRMLNDFFTPITGIIFEHNGTIDKYVGDLVMAFWGAPIHDDNHRQNAVHAALKMLSKVEELKPMFKERGLPEINIGIGVNSGIMNVGDMGSTFRRSYTVLGDAVNLGSRLESITKEYGVKLLIGEQTFDQLKDVLCRQVDLAKVKGKEQPIRIYQPLCLNSDASEELVILVDDYHRAYNNYLQQNWDVAEQQFNHLLKKDPATKLYSLYLERIVNLRTLTLPASWDGTFLHTSK